MLARERQRERGALARHAFCLDLAAVGFGDLARYREAQPRAAGRAGLLGLMEPLEDQRYLLLWDADAGVGDLEHGPAVPLLHLDRDATAPRCVVHGVVQEYGGDLQDV